MRMWMVLALLAMGLGCSQPEPWSHPMRQSFVDTCAAAGEVGAPYNQGWEHNQKYALERLEEGGYNVREICRGFLRKTEAEYTESDFLLLSDEERRRVIQKIAAYYSREIGGEEILLPTIWEWDMEGYHVWAKNLGGSSSD